MAVITCLPYSLELMDGDVTGGEFRSFDMVGTVSCEVNHAKVPAERAVINARMITIPKIRGLFLRIIITSLMNFYVSNLYRPLFSGMAENKC